MTLSKSPGRKDGFSGRMSCERLPLSGLSFDWGGNCVKADVLLIVYRDRERAGGGTSKQNSKVVWNWTRVDFDSKP